ncbi:MAG TPA: hypothetical protein VGM09_17995 [Bradyrhizobium sp.]
MPVSEQTELTSGEGGSTGAGPIVPNSSISSPPDAAAAEPAPVSAEAPSLVPDQAAATEPPEVSTPKAEAPKEAPKADAPRQPGKLMIMSAAGRGWDHHDAGPKAQSEAKQSLFGKRRLGAMAAVVALAALAGAVGGAMATSGLQHFAATEVAAPAGTRGLEASVARIDADVAALKVGVEHSSKMGMIQFNKTSDRLDKFEKAQAESGAKLAKLSETIEKLHVTPPATPVAAAAPVTREVTGSITPPATAAAAAAPKAEAKAEVKPEAKSEVGRLPIVDSWVLQEVSRGGAWIEGRQGIYEVYAGDVVPGLGRIDAVRRQDGRWVVVTSRGLVVAR